MYELEVVNVRLVKEPSLYSEKELNSPQAVIEVMASEMAQYDREVLCILNMKSNGQAINMNIVSVGTIDQALISPREVFKGSILSNACRILAVHNHPSGSITPSQADFEITQRLKACGEILGIPLLDHLIVGGNHGRIFSFQEHGLLDGGKKKFTDFLDRFKQRKKEWER